MTTRAPAPGLVATTRNAQGMPSLAADTCPGSHKDWDETGILAGLCRPAHGLHPALSRGYWDRPFSVPLTPRVEAGRVEARMDDEGTGVNAGRPAASAARRGAAGRARRRWGWCLGCLAGVALLACRNAAPDSDPRAGAATPRPEASAALAAGGPSAAPSGRSAPPSPFELVIDDACTNETTLGDLGDRTLLSSRTGARLVGPGQSLRDARDVGAGLPVPRAPATLFATRPLVLSVLLQAHPHAPIAHEGRLYLLGHDGFGALTHDFGVNLAAVPVEAGTVVVGWDNDPQRGDPDAVPAGNVTRAALLAVDGTVTPLSHWPRVMTWEPRSAPRTIWARAARPGQPGNFILRVPLAGEARFYPIPGTGTCRGTDRAMQLATVDEATDDSVRVTVERYIDCIAAGAAAIYRLHTPSGRWVREGEAPAWRAPEPEGARVEARGVTFELEDGRVAVTDGRATERVPLDVVAPRPNDPDRQSRLVVTAGGRDVWVRTRAGSRCKLYRYAPRG